MTLALFVGAVIGGDARAGLPMMRWRGENWHPFLLYNMNPRHPNPALGRLLGRTKALDRWQVPPPIGAQRLPVSVYTLPHVDRHIAVYVAEAMSAGRCWCGAACGSDRTHRSHAS